MFAQYGYRNIRVPIVEPTRAVRARHRRGDRHRREGDVHVRGQAERREPDAAPRGDRRHRARGDRAQRSPTSGRSACGPAGPMFRHERPQKGRYRQFHQFDVEALASPGPDVDAEQIVMLARLWQRARPRRRHRAARSTRSATPTSAARTATTLDRVLRAPRRRCSTTTRSAACTPIRCASSTARIPAMQDDDRGRAAGSSTASATRRARISTACSALLARRGHRLRDRTRAWCAASTTTTAPCSSGSPTGSARRARSPAAAATTACSSSSAASRRRPAASRSASSG